MLLLEVLELLEVAFVVPLKYAKILMARRSLVWWPTIVRNSFGLLIVMTNVKRYRSGGTPAAIRTAKMRFSSVMRTTSLCNEESWSASKETCLPTSINRAWSRKSAHPAKQNWGGVRSGQTTWGLPDGFP